MNISIAIEETNKVLSAHGGLVFFDDLVNKLGFQEKLNEILPAKGKNQYKKFKSLLLGFVCGLDCLDDISKLRLDPVFSELTEGACADSTLGDFLRGFSKRQIEKLGDLLMDLSLKLRSILFPEENFVIYSSDSTPAPQTGQMMEGLGWNYKKQWGLDFLGLYDHRGFHYGMDVREGGTYSSNGNSVILGKVLRKSGNNLKKFFHGDSAFANLDHYNTCLNGNCHFVMALGGNAYGPLLRKNDLKWKKTDLQFFKSDNCEVTQCLYHIEGLAGGRTHLRAILLRAPKNEKQENLFGEKYDYYGLVTDIGEHEKLPVLKKKESLGKRGARRKDIEDWRMEPATIESIICFYRSRGNTENFLKEEKNGLDLKHYPMKKLNANKVFGIVGAMAYNLMRFGSFFISKRGCYSKKIRFFLVHLPCQVVRHARKLIIRFNNFVKKEVCKRLEQLHSLFNWYDQSS